MASSPPYGAIPGRRDITTHGNSLVVYTTAEAWGAWRNGTRVAKAGAVDYDEVPDGTLGTVIGSNETQPGRYFYYVVWDNRPYTVAGLAGLRLLGIEDGVGAMPSASLMRSGRRRLP